MAWTETHEASFTSLKNVVRTCNTLAPAKENSKCILEYLLSQGPGTGPLGTKTLQDPKFYPTGFWARKSPCFENRYQLLGRLTTALMEALENAEPLTENKPMMLQVWQPILEWVRQTPDKQRGATLGHQSYVDTVHVWAGRRDRWLTLCISWGDTNNARIPERWDHPSLSTWAMGSTTVHGTQHRMAYRRTRLHDIIQNSCQVIALKTNPNENQHNTLNKEPWTWQLKNLLRKIRMKFSFSQTHGGIASVGQEHGGKWPGK